MVDGAITTTTRRGFLGQLTALFGAATLAPGLTFPETVATAPILETVHVVVPTSAMAAQGTAFEVFKNGTWHYLGDLTRFEAQSTIDTYIRAEIDGVPFQLDVQGAVTIESIHSSRCVSNTDTLYRLVFSNETCFYFLARTERLL